MNTTRLGNRYVQSKSRYDSSGGTPNRLTPQPLAGLADPQAEGRDPSSPRDASTDGSPAFRPFANSRGFSWLPCAGSSQPLPGHCLQDTTCAQRSRHVARARTRNCEKSLHEPACPACSSPWWPWQLLMRARLIRNTGLSRWLGSRMFGCLLLGCWFPPLSKQSRA